MRITDLYESDIKDGTVLKLNDMSYKWDADKKRWIDSRGIVAGGGASVELMKSLGRDPLGRVKKGSSLLKRAQAAIDRRIGGSLSGAIKSDDTFLGKVMGHAGAALGRGLSKVIAPKAPATKTTPTAAQAAATKTTPTAAQAAATKFTPQAPKLGVGDTRQGAVQVDQDLGNIINQMRAYQPTVNDKPLPTKMNQAVMKDLANVRNNKDWAVMTGSKILKFAGAGYDVKDLHQKWSAEVAVGKKQKIMQDIYSEELLERLIKLAGI